MRLDISPVGSGLSVTTAVANDFAVKAECKNAKVDVLCKVDGVLPQGPVYIPVTVTIDGTESTSSVIEGGTLAITLTPASGKQIKPWTVAVTLGSTDVTSTAYDASTNTVTISNVTEEVSITASAITMDSAYQPVKYIQITTRGTGNAIRITDFKPSNLTKLVLDVALDVSVTSTTTLFSLWSRNPNTAASSSNPRLHQWIRLSTASNFGFYWGTKATNPSNAPGSQRQTITMDKGKLTHKDVNGTTRTNTLTDSAWTATYDLSLFGNAANSQYTGCGKIYQVTIYENAVLQRDYIPCKKASDGKAGLYDKVNGTFIAASAYTPVYT